MTETAHFIKRIILTSRLNEYILTNKKAEMRLVKLLCSTRLDDEYFGELFKFIEIKCSSFEEAVCALLEKCEKDTQTEILMARVFNQKQSEKPSFRKLGPRLVKLPQTYAEFQDKYFDVRCSLCKKLSPMLNGCICLICGEIVCGNTCDFIGKGNLNNHAKDYHMGLGYFLDRHTLQKVLINTPTNCNLPNKGLYIDQFGQEITLMLQNPQEVMKLDYSKFFLNPASEQDDKEIINQHSLGKVCFKATTLNPTIFPSGTF